MFTQPVTTRIACSLWIIDVEVSGTPDGTGIHENLDKIKDLQVKRVVGSSWFHVAMTLRLLVDTE